MSHWARPLRRSFVVMAILLAPAAFADNEAFTKARQLFDQKQYVAAQEALLKLDKKDLSEEEAREFDRLMKVLPEAVQGAQKAEQDSSAGAKAYDEARWDDADKLYAAVADNPHASAAQVDNAKSQRQKIAEKKQLSDAVKPAAPQGAMPAPAAAPAPAQEPEAAPAAMTPEAPARLTPAAEAALRDSLLWQRALAKAQQKMQSADTSVNDTRYEDARNLAAEAIHQIEANRAFAPTPEAYNAAYKQVLDYRDRVGKDIADKQAGSTQAQQEEIRRRLQERRELLERQRREKVEQLFLTARQLYAERAYADASEAMRQVLLLEPANTQALHLLQMYEDRASLSEQGRISGEYVRQMQGALLETDETKIPWHQDILYPRNWLEISRRRDLESAGVRPDDSGERNMKLESKQPEVVFNDEPLDKAIEWLRDTNEINLSVDWDDLEANGVDRTRAVSLKLRDVSLRTALDEVLAQVGRDVKLSYAPMNGVLRVASKQKLDKHKFSQVYDIRDLIIDIPKFANSPRLDISSAGVAKAGGGDIFRDPADSMFASASMNESEAGSRTIQGLASAARDERMIAGLMDVIRTNISPDSWRESGGGDASLRELNGQLVVYQTSDSQQQVRDLLKQLRDTRALMIGVEARFLIVGSNFLNEIGVDLDFVFNQGTAGFDPATNTSGQAIVNPFTGSPVLIPRRTSRLGILPAVPQGIGGDALGTTQVQQPYGQAGLVPMSGGIAPSFSEMTPIGAQQSSLGLVNPQTVSTGIPGGWGEAVAGAPALNIVGSFLDNLQVDFLIRATQANRRSSIVQAPRLMMFNGQRAWVAVVNNRQYVSSVTPSVAEGAVGVAPLIGNVQSGTSLDVEGTISHDKKYVTLTVRTGLANEPIITPFETQRGSGNSPSIFVTLTQQEIRAIRTTVSVPDGGTILLGGLKQTGEIEVEAGVPILSKIPVLKRAFTNTTMVKDTQTLLILLKAKILIQQEAEQEAFPTFASERG